MRQRTTSAFSISIKLNSVEFQERGVEVGDVKKMCELLEEKGFDWVELSGGTYQKLAWDHSLYRESTRKREAFCSSNAWPCFEASANAFTHLL